LGCPQFRSELVKNIKLPYLFRENFVAIEEYMRLIRKIPQLRNHEITFIFQRNLFGFQNTLSLSNNASQNRRQLRALARNPRKIA
jgi:hypothetical protein